ncbi:hypothetical protein PHISCL_04257 [Aspergillus sclerotialis]|uniref:Phosphotransferase enzyme family n=1 Tax=Aspergillus sclerotialis TaxID=2070753 RepID=A0A3A2ZZR8_9EURO|nr:hypothetical protein PHISCL_04257 [Aspergillus sclerotialis]
MWGYHEFPRPCGAYGTFRASSANGSDITIIKIIMQIPYHGSEFAIPAERGRQASTKLPFYGRDMLKVFETLTNNKCTSSPALISVNHEKQDDESKMVPGGFMTYLLLEHLPGIQMGPCFWDLNREERDKIRSAFRTSWEECMRSRFHPWGRHSLFWDADSNKVTSTYDRYFFKFGDKRREPSRDLWTEYEWILFGLAEGPRNPNLQINIFDALKGSCDTSAWRM